jgi:hypothetical protein
MAILGLTGIKLTSSPFKVHDYDKDGDIIGLSL